MPTLYLIDGYAQFFRAYHAIRTPMTSPVTKEPTNMTFGFVGMLLKLLRGEGQVGGPPDYVAVALDVSGDRGTFRSELYEDYKATRSAPPEDLAPQVERALALLHAIGVPTLGAEGFEADDVIATLAARLHKAHPDLNIRVISKDKDLKQLLRAGTGAGGAFEMYDIHTDQVISAETLREESGLSPQQVVDYLALMGDTVDNVPGVEGVGPKTAAQLIAKYGSLDALMADAANIKGKRGERLREAADKLPLSKELVTLRADTPVDFELVSAAVESFEPAKLMPILKELGFNRYQEDLKVLLGLDAPADPSPRSKKTREVDHGGFGGLFDAAEPAEPRAADNSAYVCVRTEAELATLADRLREADVIAVDTETTSIRSMRADLCGLSFSVEPDEAWYVPVRAPEGEACLDEAEVLKVLGPILEDKAKAKVGHNLKYDMTVLRRAGIRLGGTTIAPGGDTMVASYLIDASRSSHSMDALSLALLGRENISIKELIGTGKNQKTFDQVPLAQASPYAAEDADVTLQLGRAMHPEVAELGLEKLYREVELPLIEVLAELEWNGIEVDADELDRQRERLVGRIEELKTQIADDSMESIGRTFEPDSPKQLSGALFNTPEAEEPGLGLKPIKKTKTGYSTDAEVLQKLVDDASIESPIPALILEYRQLTKLVSTYLVALKEEINPTTGRVHASFNQTVAATGRLSSSDPNLQNIPIRTDIGREIRRAFVAPEGRSLITADYSQIELRVLAHLSRDEALIDAFRKGADIHTAVAAQIHAIDQADVTRDQRSGAKMVNFGIVYGITAFGLARRLGVSNAEAQSIIEGYKARFPGITTFLQECVEQAKAQGFVETMLKRRRPIVDIESNNPSRRALAERMAINSVVQGSAADLIKLAMIDLHARIRDASDAALKDVKMLLQIHDELVFEAPAEGAERARDVIVDRMERAMELDVPLVVDSGISANWYEGK